MRGRKMLLVTIALLIGYGVGYARLAWQTPTEARAAQFAAHDRTAYTLPPEKLERAVTLDRTRRTLVIGETLWTPATLVLILALGAAARMRDCAVRLSKHRWVQGFGYVFLLLLALRLLDLPLEVYGHCVALSYGLSVQGWGSWLADRGKMFGLEWGIGAPVVLLMFWIIRRLPERWWFWSWIPTALLVVAGVFATPYVIDPLFNQFEPLSKADPALVQRLEQVVARSGIPIPPERMFLMKASAKSTELNAYVTGFGASKRVVVWDTTVSHSTPDEIAFIFAHEMGHYALGHVVLGVALTCVGLLPLFWIGYGCVRILLKRFGPAWSIPAQHDWGALAVMLLVAVSLSTLTEPVANAFSRAIEHNADVYGQEAMHGIVADPQAVGWRSFQVLGEESLDDPTPHPAFEWWFDTHPTIRFRTAFARTYDPWAAGELPKYFAK
jgi:Zn-dependent protease with chaperone function